MNTRLLSV